MQLTDLRQPFDASLRAEALVVAVPDLTLLSEADRAHIARPFNRYGFVVIEHAPTRDPRAQLVALSGLLGRVDRHDRADGDGIVAMAPSEMSGDYVGATAGAHPLHTDGAYDPAPPLLTCLQCVRQAREGGDSVLVSGKALYDGLAGRNAPGWEALFAPDAMTVTRAGRSDTKAVFHETGAGVRIAWRDDFATTFAGRPEVAGAVEQVRSYLHHPDHQVSFRLEPNQVLVIDNVGVVHGRTAFCSGGRRHLNRMNNHGGSEFSRGLAFGFGKGPPAGSGTEARPPG